MTSFIDLLSEFENLSYVFAGYARSHNDRRIWHEIKIIFEIVEDIIAVFVVEVGLSNDENNALAGFGNFASERLIEL